MKIRFDIAGDSIEVDGIPPRVGHKVIVGGQNCTVCDVSYCVIKQKDEHNYIYCAVVELTYSQ